MKECEQSAVHRSNLGHSCCERLRQAEERIANLIEKEGRGVYCREHGAPHDFAHMDRDSCPDVLRERLEEERSRRVKLGKRVGVLVKALRQTNELLRDFDWSKYSKYQRRVTRNYVLLGQGK